MIFETLLGFDNPHVEECRKIAAAGAIVLDVRSPEEFEAGHLPFALNIPLKSLTARLGELGPPPRAIVVYCRSGMRSAVAANVLRRAGYTVCDLGAMENWDRAEPPSLTTQAWSPS
jgi:phage shock protein E